MGVRLGGHYPPRESDDYLRFLNQYGVDDVVISFGMLTGFPPATGDGAPVRLDFLELEQIRNRCEDAGLRIGALESGGQFPNSPFAMDKIWLGLAGRDEQLATLADNIRTIGRAGIPVLGYHWMVNPPGMPDAAWRQSKTTRRRGGALVGSCDVQVLERAPLSRERVYTEEEMWANYAYFLQAILPVCQEAGVKLALHPADPPVASLGGVPRLFYDVAGFERAMALADHSPYSGLNLCLGNWTAMGTDLVAAIRRFGARGQIVYGHHQGVQDSVPRFTECFLDEADCDFLAVIRALNEVGFDGCIAPAHFPRTVGDTDGYHIGTAFALGYLRGLIQAASRPAN